MKNSLKKFMLASSIGFALAGFGGAGIAASAPAKAAPPQATAPSIADQIGDARREAQIWTTYATNPHLHAFDLKVEVRGDKAMLNGTVQNGAAKDLAEQIALGVEGIKRVDNRLVINNSYEPPKRVAGERSFGDLVSDATITASVKSKLLWDSHTDGLDIHVDTNNGRVTLTGTVASGTEKDLAGHLAMNTKDVVGVNNELAVGGKPGTTTQAKEQIKTAAKDTQEALSDGWITTKVKSSLMLTRDVEGSEISVTTDNGVVKLSGNVDSNTGKQRAVEVAQNIRGVKKVDSSAIKVE
jgi:hyperosmotically inducible protein